MRENRDYHRDSARHHHATAGPSGSLGDLLDRCAHFFTHRIGGSRRGQESVMASLAVQPNITQKELADQLGVIPASLSEVLRKLERKGFVVRSRDENDHRIVRVKLTPEGEQELNGAEQASDDPFQPLSQEEQDMLAQLLSKLLAGWETRYAGRNRQGGRGEQHGHRRRE